MHEQADNTLQQEENPFMMSVGDLMAALLLIFVLLLSWNLLQLTEQSEERAKKAKEYKNIRLELYNDLNRAFQDSLESWGAEIDSNLVIRFKEPDVLFRINVTTVSERYQQILTNFFPRYIDLLYQVKYRDEIEEIRIEGHTSSEGPRNYSKFETYFFNMNLSQQRTQEVLKYSLALLSNNPILQDWTQFRITANGLSSSKVKKIIVDGIEVEDPQKSRRVEFSVRTNAERQIERIIQTNNL